MKERLLIITTLLLGSFHLLAQNRITGTVIDKDGNPIPGAKVEVKGGTESTITELDGTFVLETQSPVKKVKVYYVGMQSKEQKVKPDMIIKMSKSGWWREKPDKYRWFLGVQAAFPDCEDQIKPSWGLMVGRVKNFGWYVKGVYNKTPSSEESYDPLTSVNHYWLTGNMDQSYWNATGGVMCRLRCPIYLYVGAGYSKRTVTWETFDGSNLEYSPDCYYGAVIECGLMLKIRKLFLNMGVMLNNDSNHFKDRVGNFGIGYCF